MGAQQHVKVKPIYRSGTHIVCTLGPSSRSVENIASLLEHGAFSEWVVTLCCSPPALLEAER
jgi:hypothetical protein